ncbi:ethanolamine ammonia-lyase subunit EutB [Brevibacillus antibioticus]|uniref:Ethanolamine ammonia-lyase large subunit n=1 Tax=Brevibacillus antibioticus TaxID=2570228 RepID=A0A4U2YC36_9BACL|nr:ethanolamine ammonia-lyase subunit EutB [Brevibacillus antibioticus]TKI58376.1 ethanolamine ammonia-lyase subunit EutB [Brevibacillus antibioticus]
MNTKTTVLGQTYQFRDLKEVFAKANEDKSGDQLAGLAAADSRERVAAKQVLADLTLADIRNNPMVPAEEDEVSRVIEEGINEKIYSEIKNWSVAELREYILSHQAGDNELKRISRGLSSEMIAATAKLMSNLDLITAASKIKVVTHANTAIGQKGILASRVQPNHPSDNVQGIKASLYEGLSYGIGDAVIGINPVIDTADSVKDILNMTKDVMTKFDIPTQNCVLAHVSTQMRAIRNGAPADLIFQSLAGSEKGNNAFGIDVALLDEADELMRKEGTSYGPNFWYFETGQGSELSSEAHHGMDQVTMEARCYGLARKYNPFIVNTVVGFIGPEYLYDSRQVIRAGLEDHYMGKMHGLPMGCDVCYTNHMKVDQNDMDNLGILLSSAGVNFVIGVAMADDVMLNYQSTSFHDIAAFREVMGLRPAPDFEKWLEKMGIMENGRLTAKAGDPTIFM